MNIDSEVIYTPPDVLQKVTLAKQFPIILIIGNDSGDRETTIPIILARELSSLGKGVALYSFDQVGIVKQTNFGNNPVDLIVMSCTVSCYKAILKYIPYARIRIIVTSNEISSIDNILVLLENIKQKLAGCFEYENLFVNTISNDKGIALFIKLAKMTINNLSCHIDYLGSILLDKQVSLYNEKEPKQETTIKNVISQKKIAQKILKSLKKK